MIAHSRLNAASSIRYDGLRSIDADLRPMGLFGLVESREVEVNKRKLESYRNLLEGRLAVLIDASTDTVESMAGERPPQHADPTDRASMETDRSFILRMRDRDRKLINKIEDALKRIEEGSFGTCIECGEIISEKRLKARPVTTLCIDCKEEAEIIESKQAG